MKRTFIQKIFHKSDSSILQKVLFIGGRSHFPSVRVRCIQVARAVGCDYITEIDSFENIPKEKTIFICVKPLFNKENLEKLQKHGIVIWDIIDNYCPRNFVDYYLVSSRCAFEEFKSSGAVHIIPHHHCNFANIPNAIRERKKATWVGSSDWIPNGLNFDFEVYDSKKMTTDAVVNAYCNSTILLNIRSSISITSESVIKHIQSNSGIKLINSIGFGVPSISNVEPAYLEIAPECTIFAKNEECEEWVNRLQQDSDLYIKLRNNCILKSSDYSLPNIAKKYLNFLMHQI